MICYNGRVKIANVTNIQVFNIILIILISNTLKKQQDGLSLSPVHNWFNEG